MFSDLGTLRLSIRAIRVILRLTSMSEKTEPQRMEKIVSLCKRRGFIFQSSEIYGGLNGVWDYGPLGIELKSNLKQYWWRVMVHERDDVVGMDGSILTHPRGAESERSRGYF